MFDVVPSLVLPLQMLSKLRRGHSRVMTEEMAEIKFAGEVQLGGDVFYRKPFVGEEVLASGTVRVGMFGVQVRAENVSLDLTGEVPFRLIHAPPVAAAENGSSLGHLRRSLRRPHDQ